MELLQAVFLILMVVSAITAMIARDLLAASIVFGVFSFFSATLYIFMGALDVAFTEAVIGGVTTIFFVTVLYRSSRRASP